MQVRRRIRLNPDVHRGFIRAVRLPPLKVAINFCHSPRKGGVADLVKQGAVAAAAGVLLTPVAALLGGAAQ
jgi:hypothetical protein